MLAADATHAAPRAPWLERTRSWVFLAILGGLIGLGFLLSFAAPATFWSPPSPGLEHNDARCNDPTFPQAGYGFFYDKYWLPILCDEGYNTFNTATWAVLLGLLLLWAYRLTNELGERVGLSLVLAVVPFLVWGSVYRVLEDADLFAPYDGAPPPGSPAGGFLDSWLGVFFITPIIYVEIAFIAVGLLLWGRRARRAAERGGLARGLQHFAYSLVLLTALYAALWASSPTYMRYVANPLVAVGAAVVSYWVVHQYTLRRGWFNQHVALGAYGIFFLLIGTYYVLLWMTGGVQAWHPSAPSANAETYPLPPTAEVASWPIQWWVLLAGVLAPALVTYSVWRKGLLLSRTAPHAAEGEAAAPKPGGPTALLVVVTLVEAFAVFLTIIGLRELAQRQIADAWTREMGAYPLTFLFLAAGPLAIAIGNRLVARLGPARGFTHPHLLYFALPLNLLMVYGQMTDALMTSLGIDLYHYSEKHVLPAFLIERVDALALPGVIDAYPTAIVMITLKLLIVLLVVTAIDSSAEGELRGRENLVGLVKLGIIMVGLSPGVRDAVRLAMAI